MTGLTGTPPRDAALRALDSSGGTFETVPLCRIEIEGFRGIRRMTLELDDTTALIGENSCGKTSVLDALELALAHRATVPFFGPLDFHVPNAPGASPVERISLRFTFLESGGHEVVAEIVAARTADGSPARAIPRLVDREGRELHAGDPAAFEAFRRRHPVLRVRFGRPARPAPAEPAGPADAPSAFPGYDASGRADTASPVEGEVTRKLRRTVESAYRKFSGSWRPHPDELREPIEAARALAERWSERLQLPARAPGRAAEVLAETPVSLGATDPLRAEAREGTGMQSLALLMLLGAVLEAENGSPVDSGAESLVLIEEAEAHLHPILAARIFRLIDRVPGQKVLTTNSGDLLASVPLHAIRRLVAQRGGGQRPRRSRRRPHRRRDAARRLPHPGQPGLLRLRPLLASRRGRDRVVAPSRGGPARGLSTSRPRGSDASSSPSAGSRLS